MASAMEAKEQEQNACTNQQSRIENRQSWMSGSRIWDIYDLAEEGGGERVLVSRERFEIAHENRIRAR